MQAHNERREALYERVDFWARRLNVQPPRVRVQHMTRKWGSCSTSGTITLASDLADHDPAFTDFVIAHEVAAPASAEPRKAVQGSDERPRAQSGRHTTRNEQGTSLNIAILAVHRVWPRPRPVYWLFETGGLVKTWVLGLLVSVG